MAWWLVDSIINGTLDEDYPIMSKDKVTIFGGGGNDTISLESSENATADYITFTGLSSAVAAADTISLDYSWWDDDGFSITGNPGDTGSDTINLGYTHLPGGMGTDHISFDVGAGNTAYDDPKYYSWEDIEKPKPDLNSLSLIHI